MLKHGQNERSSPERVMRKVMTSQIAKSVCSLCELLTCSFCNFCVTSSLFTSAYFTDGFLSMAAFLAAGPILGRFIASWYCTMDSFGLMGGNAERGEINVISPA